VKIPLSAEHAYVINCSPTQITAADRNSRDESISALKEAIKAKKAPHFNHFPADNLRLWRANNIPDNENELIEQLTSEHSVELLATKKISKYFSDGNKPLNECIHVIIEVPLVLGN